MEKYCIAETLDPEIAAHMSSRRDALHKLSRIGLAAATLPVAMGVFARSAFGQSLPQQVVDVLNFALTLEYLEAEFYNTGLATSGLIPAETTEVFQQIARHENAHVALLKEVLGGRAVAKPQFDFTAGGAFNPFEEYPVFLALSQGFEDTGVRAYKGQAPMLMGSSDLLAAALRIHAVEARHAAMVRRLRGSGAEPPDAWIAFARTDVPALAPVYQGEDVTEQLGVAVPEVSGVSAERVTEAFDEPLTKAAVLDIANLFIAS